MLGTKLLIKLIRRAGSASCATSMPAGRAITEALGLMEIGTHVLTHVIKYGGHCQSVTAHATTRGRPITPQEVLPAPRGNGIIAGDHVTATLQFANGVTGTLLQHQFKKIELDAHVVELYGTEGRLMWHPRGAWWLPNPHVPPTNERDGWEVLTPIYADSFAQAVETTPGNINLNEGDYWFVDEYVRALDEGREHECSGCRGESCHRNHYGYF